MDLLDTRDGRGFITSVLAVLVQCCVDLARAHDHAFNLVVGFNIAVFVARVGNDPLEVGVTSEFLYRRAGHGVTKQILAKEEYQGLAELTIHLSSQDVKHVAWLCQIGNLHVAVLVLAVEPVFTWEDARILVAKL